MARDVHPDRHLASPPAERARAERVMRKVNEAWTVLGDPARRAAYDRTLAAASRPPPVASPPRPAPDSGGRGRAAYDQADGDDDRDDDSDLAEVGPGAAFVIRFLPLALLAGVLFLLIIVTAVAGNQGDDGGPTTPDPGQLEVIDCVTLDEIGGVVYPQRVGCGGDFDAVVVAEVLNAAGCPPGIEGIDFGGRVLCVQRVDPGP